MSQTKERGSDVLWSGKFSELGRFDAPPALYPTVYLEEPTYTYMQVQLLALSTLGAHTKKVCPRENPYVERTLELRGTYQKSAPLPENPYVERTFEALGAHK